MFHCPFDDAFVTVGGVSDVVVGAGGVDDGDGVGAGFCVDPVVGSEFVGAVRVVAGEVDDDAVVVVVVDAGVIAVPGGRHIGSPIRIRVSGVAPL